jgi:hypothetical protein
MHNLKRFNMKKLATTFKVFAVISVLALNSCRDENNEITQQETAQTKVTTADLKKKRLLFLHKRFRKQYKSNWMNPKES